MIPTEHSTGNAQPLNILMAMMIMMMVVVMMTLVKMTMSNFDIRQVKSREILVQV